MAFTMAAIMSARLIDFSFSMYSRTVRISLLIAGSGGVRLLSEKDCEEKKGGPEGPP